MFDQEEITIGLVRAVAQSRDVYVDGKAIEITSREFALLYHLMVHAGKIVSREELNDVVWGGKVKPSSNTIDVSICHVRTKIGDEERLIIRSIRGVGYFYAVR